MTDAEYDYLVASHGDAVPPRDRLRPHPAQLPALDSLLRVMRELGIDQEGPDQRDVRTRRRQNLHFQGIRGGDQ